MQAMRFVMATALAVTAMSSLARAQSLTFEQPAPDYAYDEKRPRYLHFKQVTISRISKYSLRFDFALQGALPTRFPKTEGIRYKVYFDLDGMVCDYQERKVPPDFASDLIIAVYQNPGESRFESWVDVVQVRNKVHEIKVTKLRADADHVSFQARCQLFGEVEGLRFLVSSGRLVRENGNKKDLGGQDSKVFAVPYKASGLDHFLSLSQSGLSTD